MSVLPARPRVRIEIGVLSLPAGVVSVAGANAVRAAVSHELAQLLATPAAHDALRAAAADARIETLAAGRIQLSGARAGPLGAQIAQRVADGISRAPRTRGRR